MWRGTWVLFLPLNLCLYCQLNQHIEGLLYVHLIPRLWGKTFLYWPFRVIILVSVHSVITFCIPYSNKCIYKKNKNKTVNSNTQTKKNTIGSHPFLFLRFTENILCYSSCKVLDIACHSHGSSSFNLIILITIWTFILFTDKLWNTLLCFPLIFNFLQIWLHFKYSI